MLQKWSKRLMGKAGRWLGGSMPEWRALQVALIYAVLAGLWIAFSDDTVARLSDDPAVVTELQTLKGGFFVLVTAILLYFLTRRACTGLIQAHGQAARAAHDELTGLPGRARINELVEQAVRKAADTNAQTAVVAIDIDRLRRVNEAYGVAAGDGILLQMADRLRSFRRRDMSVARPGSDHFVVVVEAPCGRERAWAIAEQLVSMLEAPYEIGGEALELGINAGVAVFPEHAADGRELMRTAEMAVHDARRCGKPIAFHAGRSREFREVFSLESGLRGALERNEYQIYFQPIVRLEEGDIVGAEALLRWEHPRLGLVAPARFVPLLEESGEILPVGRWVLEEAIRHALTWPGDGALPMRLSVNVSRVQLASHQFVSVVEEVVRSNGFPPERLVLEITESLAMRDPGQTMATLHALRQVGVGIAMDDFGTGYSSLAYLKRYPLDFIKVDRLLVQGIPHDRENDLLMETIIEMGRRLGRHVLAEGVETESEAMRLMDLGCGLAQGYLFSPPVPAGRFRDMLAASRRPPGRVSAGSP
jgi:diguanylate cyclase (GGDEF)-like protein